MTSVVEYEWVDRNSIFQRCRRAPDKSNVRGDSVRLS